MKTAIYIEDGVTQLVITPETEFEHNAIKAMNETAIECKIFHGSFYDCRGGWVTQSAYHSMSMCEDNSLIVQARKKQEGTTT